MQRRSVQEGIAVTSVRVRLSLRFAAGPGNDGGKQDSGSGRQGVWGTPRVITT